jgi:hypothetical protein
MICAGGHTVYECVDGAPKKCVSCGAAHEAFSSECPVYSAEKAKANKRRRGGKKKKDSAQQPAAEPRTLFTPSLGTQNAWGRGNASHAAPAQRPAPKQRLEFPALPTTNAARRETAESLRIPLRELRRNTSKIAEQVSQTNNALLRAAEDDNPLQGLLSSLAAITTQLQQSMSLLTAALATIPSVLGNHHAGQP